MILVLDVHYLDNSAQAVAAGILFEQFSSEKSHKEIVKIVDNIQPYTPGEFYKRELPCLLAIIESIEEKIDYILVDGYVTLSENRMGLGGHLFEKIPKKIPVIGIAKNKFHDSNALELNRGESNKPLWITSIGIDNKLAAQYISEMFGDFRIPYMLKKVDSLFRNYIIDKEI